MGWPFLWSGWSRLCSPSTSPSPEDGSSCCASICDASPRWKTCASGRKEGKLSGDGSCQQSNCYRAVLLHLRFHSHFSPASPARLDCLPKTDRTFRLKINVQIAVIVNHIDRLLFQGSLRLDRGMNFEEGTIGQVTFGYIFFRGIWQQRQRCHFIIIFLCSNLKIFFVLTFINSFVSTFIKLLDFIWFST